MGNYHTVLVGSAPVHIYSRKEADATYIASVVDLQDRATEGASLMIEAEFNLTLLGDISANEISRVEPGKAAVFGHFITIDCRNDKAPDQPGQTAAWGDQSARVRCARTTSQESQSRIFRRVRFALACRTGPRSVYTPRQV